MNEDKMFELMTKMYSDLTNRLDKIENDQREGFQHVNDRFDKVEDRLDKVENRLDKVEITIEDMNGRIKKLAEVQQNHYEENQRNHEQIVEMLTQRLDIQDKAIKSISVVK